MLIYVCIKQLCIAVLYEKGLVLLAWEYKCNVCTNLSHFIKLDDKLNDEAEI